MALHGRLSHPGASFGELRESLPVDAEINGVVRAAVDRFMEDAEQFDDLTMPGLEYFGPAAAMEE